MADALGDDDFSQAPLDPDVEQLRDWPRWRRAALSFDMLSEVASTRSDIELAVNIGTKACKAAIVTECGGLFQVPSSYVSDRFGVPSGPAALYSM